MKKVFVQYAAYNVWANQRIADCITKLSEEQVNRVLVSSFTSIYATILHLWDAEAIWWQRLKMQEQLEIPGTAFTNGLRFLISCSRTMLMRFHVATINKFPLTIRVNAQCLENPTPLATR